MRWSGEDALDREFRQVAHLANLAGREGYICESTQIELDVPEILLDEASSDVAADRLITTPGLPTHIVIVYRKDAGTENVDTYIIPPYSPGRDPVTDLGFLTHFAIAVERSKTGERCVCGRPLHYTDRNAERWVSDLVDALGPDIEVVSEGRTWMVPRHYIALHGLKTGELPRSGFRLKHGPVEP